MTATRSRPPSLRILPDADGHVEIPSSLADIGVLPPEWEWRPNQRELVDQIVNSSKKVVLVEAECGSGKSVMGMAVAAAASDDTTILVQTIQLQEQYLNDFPGLRLMEGKRNSRCAITGGRADHAPCVAGIKCAFMGRWMEGQLIDNVYPTCEYYNRKARAMDARVRVINYAYWFRESLSEVSAFGNSEMIICDEAHKLDEILMSAATLEFKDSDLNMFGLRAQHRPPTLLSELIPWANSVYDGINRQYLDAVREARGLSTTEVDGTEVSTGGTVTERVRVGRELVNALRELRNLTVDSLKRDWVVHREPRTTLVKPIYGKYGFRHLYDKAESKLVLMSAFLAPELLIETLDIPREDVEIIKAPPVYNRARSPIVYCPTVKLKHSSSQQERKFVYNTVDEIISYYGDSKGLIHVPSVAMRDALYASSRFKKRLVVYDGSGTFEPRFSSKDEAIKRFTESDEPLVLLGQSISTGLDLPYIPKWQIIAKVAFPSKSDPAVEKRMEVDKFYYPFQTICEIVQAAGRVKRAPDHHGTTIILDEQFGWFLRANFKHFPPWFLKAYSIAGWDMFPDIKRKLPRIAGRSGVIYSAR